MPNKKAMAGFTLVEVLVTIGISLLFFGAIADFFINSIKSSNIISDQLEGQGEARRVVNDFVSQVRVASYSSAGDYPLKVASSSEIIFFANIDKDSMVEQVRYFLTSTTLYRGITKPTGNPLLYDISKEDVQVVAEGVRLNGKDLFTYYPAGIADPLISPVDITAVRLVGIYLRIDKKPEQSPTAWSVSARAEMRNLEKQ